MPSRTPQSIPDINHNDILYGSITHCSRTWHLDDVTMTTYISLPCPVDHARRTLSSGWQTDTAVVKLDSDSGQIDVPRLRPIVRPGFASGRRRSLRWAPQKQRQRHICSGWISTACSYCYNASDELKSMSTPATKTWQWTLFVWRLETTSYLCSRVCSTEVSSRFINVALRWSGRRNSCAKNMEALIVSTQHYYYRTWLINPNNYECEPCCAGISLAYIRSNVLRMYYSASIINIPNSRNISSFINTKLHISDIHSERKQ